jgi:hypothetical protein
LEKLGSRLQSRFISINGWVGAEVTLGSKPGCFPELINGMQQPPGHREASRICYGLHKKAALAFGLLERRVNHTKIE